MKPVVLVSTDDDILSQFLKYVLRAENCDILLTGGVEETIRRVADKSTRLVIADCRSRPGDGVQLCGRLRLNGGDKPVSILAITGSDPDAAAYILAAGANKCVAGLIVPEQLMTWVRAVLGSARGNTDQLLEHDGIRMDIDAYQVQRDGEPVDVSPTEFRLLRIFMGRPDKVFSRGELTAGAWPKDVHVGPRTVDVHVGRLRKALTARSARDPIRTVRSVGYGLADDDAGDA